MILWNCLRTDPLYEVYPELSIALWCRDMITLEAARQELNMESECLQCLSPDLRSQFLGDILLADIAGDCVILAHMYRYRTVRDRPNHHTASST